MNLLEWVSHNSPIRIFNDSKVIKIFYNLANSEIGGRPIFIEINDPTQKIIVLFDSFFNRFSVFPKISQIEIAFDFYTNDPVNLKEFLDRHLLLKYQRRPSFSIKGTFYTIDVRKTSKGTRTYPKKIDGKRAVRLELVLNRRLIKALRLEFPLESLDKIDFRKYFSFRFLDLERITASLIRANSEDIAKLDKEDGISGQLIIREIESWVRTMFINEVPQDEKLMRHVEILKSKDRGISNYGRFLKDLTDVNQDFITALTGKQFLRAKEMK